MMQMKQEKMHWVNMGAGFYVHNMMHFTEAYASIYHQKLLKQVFA